MAGPCLREREGRGLASPSPGDRGRSASGSGTGGARLGAAQTQARREARGQNLPRPPACPPAGRGTWWEGRGRGRLTIGPRRGRGGTLAAQ